MSTTGWIVLGVIAVVVLWAIMVYNNLVAMAQRTNQAFADIDVQLKSAPRPDPEPRRDGEGLRRA